jgi:hypothetical protein
VACITCPDEVSRTQVSAISRDFEAIAYFCFPVCAQHARHWKLAREASGGRWEWYWRSVNRFRLTRRKSSRCDGPGGMLRPLRHTHTHTLGPTRLSHHMHLLRCVQAQILHLAQSNIDKSIGSHPTLAGRVHCAELDWGDLQQSEAAGRIHTPSTDTMSSALLSRQPSHSYTTLPLALHSHSTLPLVLHSHSNLPLTSPSSQVDLST